MSRSSELVCRSTIAGRRCNGYARPGRLRSLGAYRLSLRDDEHHDTGLGDLLLVELPRDDLPCARSRHATNPAPTPRPCRRHRCSFFLVPPGNSRCLWSPCGGNGWRRDGRCGGHSASSASLASHACRTHICGLKRASVPSPPAPDGDCARLERAASMQHTHGKGRGYTSRAPCCGRSAPISNHRRVRRRWVSRAPRSWRRMRAALVALLGDLRRGLPSGVSLCGAVWVLDAFMYTYSSCLSLCPSLCRWQSTATDASVFLFPAPACVCLNFRPQRFATSPPMRSTRSSSSA